VFAAHRAHRALHSFPTRRSSDLRAATPVCSAFIGWPDSGRFLSRSTSLYGSLRWRRSWSSKSASCFWVGKLPLRSSQAVTASSRSEEHTSELQSRSDLVCRLLLE